MRFDGDVMSVRVVGRGVDDVLGDGRSRGRIHRLGEREPRGTSIPCVSLSVLCNEFLLGSSGRSGVERDVSSLDNGRLIDTAVSFTSSPQG